MVPAAGQIGVFGKTNLICGWKEIKHIKVRKTEFRFSDRIFRLMLSIIAHFVYKVNTFYGFFAVSCGFTEVDEYGFLR
jgi:hypothetical protein